MTTLLCACQGDEADEISEALCEIYERLDAMDASTAAARAGT